jgi:hypothetical protein
MKKENDPCKQQVIFEGSCEKICRGIYFDIDKQECVEVSDSCCNSSAPFGDLETCQKQCSANKTENKNNSTGVIFKINNEKHLSDFQGSKDVYLDNVSIPLDENEAEIVIKAIAEKYQLNTYPNIEKTDSNWGASIVIPSCENADYPCGGWINIHEDTQTYSIDWRGEKI